VKYSQSQENMLGLQVNLDDAENLQEVLAFRAAKDKDEQDAKKPKTESEPEEPKPLIQLSACLARYSAPEEVTLRGSAASKMSRLATMPRYLLVQLRRYYVDEKWCPAKLDCKVPMPDVLNLEHLRARGLQPGEEELPEEAAAATQTAPSSAPQADDEIVATLISMGIGENAAKRASLAVGNSSADAATSWFFDHNEDPNINDPVEAAAPAAGSGYGGGGGGDAPDPDAVSMLCGLGFAENHVLAALKSCMNSAERAADWLFSHADDLDSAVASLGGQKSSGNAGSGSKEYDDGVGEYSLVGFVSHVGKHTSHGHYVCHMKRGEGDSWVIFDDSKVAKSEAPPLDLGYLYLYRRKDG